MEYDGVAKTLHWLVLALLIVQFALAWTMPGVANGQTPQTLVRLHLSFGLTILGIMLIRLGWRLTHPAPPPPDEIPLWQQRVSRLTHWALYALLIATPLVGWIWASAKGWPITVFGIVALPRLVRAGSLLRPLVGAAHTYLAWAILVVVALHVLAALRHHFVLRDAVLKRMLPRY